MATIPYSTPQTATQGDYYIKGSIMSTGCFSIAGSVRVIVNANATSIPTEISSALKVYSFENQIHIVNCEPNSAITIYDILGRQCYFGITNSNNETINSNFKAGIYIIKVENKLGIKSNKVFIR